MAAAIASGILLAAAVILSIIGAVTGHGVMSAAAAVCCAGVAAVALATIAYVKKETDYFKTFEQNLKDYAFVRFDRMKKEAHLSRNFEALTGVSAGSFILSETEYKRTMDSVTECCVLDDEKIYMTPLPNKWVRISEFSTKRYSCAIIMDVSDYMSCKNVIKSLKYYDMATGVLSRDAFISRLRTASESNKETIGLVHFIISGIDKVSSFSGAAAADGIIARVAAFIKKYDNPHNIFTGRTATNEFSMLITETYDDGCRKMAEKVTAGLNELINDMPGGDRSNVRVFCGYACFKGTDNNTSTMLSAADFAAFDAESRNIAEPVLFNTATYSLRAQEFKKVQVFNKLVSANSIDYHFQPIVNARTGMIYGYEALMRPKPVDGIKLNPMEMLSIAEHQEMLNEIEEMTFENTMRLLSENQEFFSNRKLFINCIPNSLMSEDAFERLLENYGGLFEKVVVEITEGSPVLSDAVETINRRFRSRNAKVALDDYGTGYSNDSTLLSVKPDYIKIDRSLITDIDREPQKQHLVRNMIEFAKQHGIMSLAEGVETLDELDMVVSLGVDLVQGFVACKATAVLMLDIPLDVKNKIIGYNLKYTGHVSKCMDIDEPGIYSIVELGIDGYNEIVIRSGDVTLKGETDVEITMSITVDVPGNDEAKIKLHNLNVASDDNEILTIAKGKDVNVELIGMNKFNRGSVRVPDTASLYLGGSGSLEIINSGVDSYGIGGSSMQDFGKIMLDCQGKIVVNSRGDTVIGIGGGTGSENSSVELIGGNVNVIVNGKDIVGIGTFTNNASISINPMKLAMTIGGQNAVGIGSKCGEVNIKYAADVAVNVSGDTCCGVGTLAKGSGVITVNGGNSDIVVRGKTITGIGAVDGNTETVLNAGTINILCEGDNATCAGDSFGSGVVKCRGAAIKAVAKASKENPVGVCDGKVYVSGGSIITSDVAPLECYSITGEKLVQVEKDGRRNYRERIRSGDETYLYNAEPVGEDVMYLYLPEAYA